ncbi:hypothetical protein [Alteromonas facilis]|uniref:hypothetical protein n=1 Tax=Alteromonas facilis TaxID=2048004 RepID=UPI00196ADAFB|nr:hypothetical protein [Alteromonas facilis]
MKLHKVGGLAALIVFSGLSVAEESKEIKIQRAMSAAPPSISAHATIVDSDGTLLKEGNNGWTCMPDTMPGDRAPMCNDAVWMEMMQALMKQADYTPDRIGISYMLQGEPSGSGVSNSSPYHHNHSEAEDYVETGPHVMLIVPKEMLKGLPSDPNVGGPYIMWGDTPYAHIMLPVSIDGKQVVTKSGM